MRRRLLNFLRCPCCGSTLRCEEIEATRQELSVRAHDRIASLGWELNDFQHAVRTGVLACSEGCSWHPILNFVPVLLYYSTPLHAGFRDR
jgi:uncharacterized protein YbaR (Trm112 family)